MRYLNTRLGAQYQPRFLQSKSTFDIGVLLLKFFFSQNHSLDLALFFAKDGKALLIHNVKLEHHKIS